MDLKCNIHFWVLIKNQDEKNKYHILTADSGYNYRVDIITVYQSADFNFGTGNRQAYNGKYKDAILGQWPYY